MGETRAPLRFSDMVKGRVFKAGPITVDAEDIKDFGRKYDPQPFHTDEVAAKDTFFEGLAASGWHTAGMTMRMFVDAMPAGGGSVGAGVDELRWPRPVRPGDVLRVECEIIDARPMMSSPGRGLVRIRVTTLNQDEEPVLRMVTTVVAPLDQD